VQLGTSFHFHSSKLWKEENWKKEQCTLSALARLSCDFVL
jgi:hypothetical protein